MKILRIKVNGLPLYKNPFDISFYAAQRVQSNHLNSVFNLFGNIFVNTVEAFAGINAAGKTTALKVISFTNMLFIIYTILYLQSKIKLDLIILNLTKHKKCLVSQAFFHVLEG